jgi:hypothetical protein
MICSWPLGQHPANCETLYPTPTELALSPPPGTTNHTRIRRLDVTVRGQPGNHGTTWSPLIGHRVKHSGRATLQSISWLKQRAMSLPLEIGANACRAHKVSAYVAITAIVFISFVGQDIFVPPADAQAAFCTFSPSSFSFDSNGGTQFGCLTGQGPNPRLPSFVSSTPPNMNIAQFTGPINTGQCSNSQAPITVNVSPTTFCGTVTATCAGGNPGTVTVTQTGPASCPGGGGSGKGPGFITVDYPGQVTGPDIHAINNLGAMAGHYTDTSNVRCFSALTS